jgi:hypothetical protein
MTKKLFFLPRHENGSWKKKVSSVQPSKKLKPASMTSTTSTRTS